MACSIESATSGCHGKSCSSRLSSGVRVTRGIMPFHAAPCTCGSDAPIRINASA